MNQQNTQPLYRILNEKRTQGKLVPSIYILTENCLRLNEGNGKVLFEVSSNASPREERDANTKYAALAINELANVADALQELTNWCIENTGSMSYPLIKAKEALKAIS